MLKGIRSIIILICILFNAQNVFAQNEHLYKDHSIYVSYGNIIHSSQASLSFEKTLFQKNTSRTRLKISNGYYLSNNADFETNAKIFDNYVSLSGVQLIGILELSGGVALSYFKLAEGFEPDPSVDYSEQMRNLQFLGNIGMRYAKDHFMFRAGIGNLELFYLGLGYNF